MDYRLRIRESALSELKLVDIKQVHVQDYYNELLKSYSVNTVKLTHKLLRSFFNYCVKEELIIRSPMNTVKLPHDDNVTTTNTAISDGDIEKLLEAAKDNIDNFIFVFAIFTGLRQGEILSLSHSDICFSENVIRVDKTVKYLTVDGEYRPEVSRPKTKGSQRDVPILDDIQGLLKTHIRNEKEKHLRLGIPFSKDSILFSSSACTYREGANVRKSLARLCKRIDIKNTTFHSLRHTFGTILAKNNVPLKTASELMGHSDIGITAKIYINVDMEEKRKGIKKLSVYFKDA